MNRRAPILLSVILATGLASLNPASAQAASCDDIRKTGRGLEAINDLYWGYCIANRNDSTPLTKDILARRQAYPEDGKIIPDERRRSVLALLERIQKELQNANSAVKDPILSKLDQAVKAVAQGDIATPVLNNTNWEYSPGDGILGAGETKPDNQDQYIRVDIRNQILAPACNTPTSDACGKATTDAESILRYAGLISLVGQFSAQDALTEKRDKARQIDDQWKLYIQKTRSQHVLELIINSHAFSRKGEGTFLPPPDYQWIVAHPSVAMEYVSKASDGSRFTPALLVEWIGYNRWDWKPGPVAAMGTAWGGSLISTFSDRAGTRSTGHGVMLHYDHVYSFGVTRHGSDTGIFVSIDLQKMIMDKQKQFEDATERFAWGR